MSMKVRNDFVTNSSSSSFIFAFTDDKSIKTELVNAFPDYAMNRFGKVFKDVQAADRLTREQVFDNIRDEYEWMASYHCYNQKFGLRRDTLTRWEWAETEEGKREIAAYLDKVVEDAKVKMDGKSVFLEVEYSDHDNGDLEHEIMPSLPVTIIQFSHH